MVISRSRTAWVSALLAVSVAVGCAGGIPPAVERVAVRIAEDVCAEVLTDAVAPGGVTLRCTAEDGKKTVTVKLPRAQWAAIKRAGVDAGPGL